MIYAVIDTNVFVSALLSRHPDSATVQVVSAISENGIRPLYNQEIIDEYWNVLHREKFHFPSEAVDSMISTIQKIGLSTDRIASNESFSDPKDVVFYEVALSKKNAFLITGNTKHFPKTSIVVTPAEMLDILQNASTNQECVKTLNHE